MANNTQTTVKTTNEQQTTAHQPSMLHSMLPIFLIMIVFYFLMMRPQQKREAKKRQMISNLKKGDQIVTLGGIIGIVHKVLNNNEISLEIAEGVRIRVLKTSIGDVLEKSKSTDKQETTATKTTTKKDGKK